MGTGEFNAGGNLACEQAHLSDPSGRSLVTKGEESEPALPSVNFSFLLLLSEVKYHWSKSRKGDKTANLLCFKESD